MAHHLTGRNSPVIFTNMKPNRNYAPVGLFAHKKNKL